MSDPQLFCYTYAGGNSSFFDGIENEISSCEVIKPDYSGHGTRYREPFYDDFKMLAEDMFSLFQKSYKGEEYALFGYSMGTIAVVELVNQIISAGDIDLPSNVFLAAHEPRTKTELSGYADEEMDSWVKERTVRFGGVPESLINNNSFWRMYLPLYRADYSLIGRYDFDELKLEVDIPATVFYSETDTPLSEMQMWKNIFIGGCEFYEYEGTHFFIKNHYKEIAQVINSKMHK